MQDKVNEVPSQEENRTVQLVVFCAEKEEFGVPISEVREIIKISAITPIPNALPFILGIINVRGEIVTIIDIKSRFSLPVDKDTISKHIIVTKQDDTLFGLQVDEVIEILRIQQKDIQPAPALITKINEKYIDSVLSHEGRLIIILNLAKILSQNEFLQLSRFSKTRKQQKLPKSNPEQ